MVFGAESVGHRTTSGRDEQQLRVDFVRLAVRRLRVDRHAVVAGLRLQHLRPGHRLDALLLEGLLELRRNGLVLDRHEARQQLDDRHLAAEAAIDRRELHAHRTAAHDRQRLRHRLEVNRFVAGDDPRAIDRDAGNAARRGAGGDDDLPRLQRLFVAIGDVDLALAGEPRGPLDPVDLVLLEQELDRPWSGR